MAFSREIIKKVLQYVRFRVPQTEEKNSYYTEIGNTLVRVSNHCTWLYRWDEILEKNPKWKDKPIVSIVFEDSGNTFSNKCLVLRRFRMKPIKVMEYVYPLQGNPQFITPQDERLIINGIKQIQGGKYTDLTNKCSEPILRISQNPLDVPPTKTMNNNENKQYKSNTNMNKKLIRLTESDLHRIVKESVKRALMENIYNTHQYQIVAYLIDPNADWQREGLSSDDYEESKRDFEILSNLNCNLNRQAINIFRKYQINSGAVEEHNSEEPFIMDIDGDGIYLLKRID